jgi:hypothetical protein
MIAYLLLRIAARVNCIKMPGLRFAELICQRLFMRKRPADRAFHAPLAHEIVCPLIGKLRGTHDERYGAFGS